MGVGKVDIGLDGFDTDSGIEVIEVAADGLFASGHAYWDQNDVRMA